jgi:hypothetical protein
VVARTKLLTRCCVEGHGLGWNGAEACRVPRRFLRAVARLLGRFLARRGRLLSPHFLPGLRGGRDLRSLRTSCSRGDGGDSDGSSNSDGEGCGSGSSGNGGGSDGSSKGNSGVGGSASKGTDNGGCCCSPCNAGKAASLGHSGR